MLITCRRHGRSPAYIACRHVMMEGAPVAHHSRADARPGVEGVGEMLCRACFDDTGDRTVLRDLLMVCTRCVQAVVHSQN